MGVVVLIGAGIAIYAGVKAAMQQLGIQEGRSVILNVENHTNYLLHTTDSVHSSGAFGVVPENNLAPQTADGFSSMDTGLFTGAIGAMTYQAEANAVAYRITWANPWAGTNECSNTVYGPMAPWQAPTCSAGGGDDAEFVYSFRSVAFQDNWRFCNKCASLTSPGPNSCPAGGMHDTSTSFNYGLEIDNSNQWRQHGWRNCPKCQGIWHTGPNGDLHGPCPAGGIHESGPIDYGIAHDVQVNGPWGQSEWRFCNRCRCLWWGGNGVIGACTAGGGHSKDGSGNYSLGYIP